ncbi:MAG: hypothetical protein HY315_08755 [Acidobacteria bacterium]|nr:hypothetical protein [Acidobacteriota bacterium]
MKNLRLIVLPALGGLAVTGILVRAGQTAQPQVKRPLVIELGAGGRVPLRVIGDRYPTFSGISMDVESDEVVLTDENRTSILTYGRLFQGTDRVIEPRREIMGPESMVGRTCSVAISPEFQELYAVNKDIEDNMIVFPLSATGNVAPARELRTDHGGWGVSLDRKHDEIVITTQHNNKVAVFSRSAKGEDPELRYIQGPKTGLASPQGVHVDGEQGEIYVANHGHWRHTEPGEGRLKEPASVLALSTGKYLPASITVYSRTASGDVAPLRAIRGPRTRLNWPEGIYLDTDSGQLAVANSTDNSVLFFDRNADGNVPPLRVIQGPATGLANPVNLFVDTMRDEIWVTNYEDHSATVYSRMAEGNIAPIRAIRSAPKGAPASGMGGTSSLVYDPKRKEILVPN